MLAFFLPISAAKIETISEVKPYHANGDGLIWESGRVGNRHLQKGKQKCLPFFFNRLEMFPARNLSFVPAFHNKITNDDKETKIGGVGRGTQSRYG